MYYKQGPQNPCKSYVFQATLIELFHIYSGEP